MPIVIQVGALRVLRPPDKRLIRMMTLLGGLGGAMEVVSKTHMPGPSPLALTWV
jgi:hypothetical protein